MECCDFIEGSADLAGLINYFYNTIIIIFSRAAWVGMQSQIFRDYAQESREG